MPGTVPAVYHGSLAVTSVARSIRITRLLGLRPPQFSDAPPQLVIATRRAPGNADFVAAYGALSVSAGTARFRQLSEAMRKTYARREFSHRDPEQTYRSKLRNGLRAAIKDAVL
jgi:hypothetical protein